MRRVSETQINSYYELSDISKRQQEVVKVLQENDTITAREIADKLDREVHQVSPRLRELMDLGLVFTAVKMKCKNTGRMVCTYTLHKDKEVKQQTYKCSTKDKAITVSSTRIEIDFENKNIILFYEGDKVFTTNNMSKAVDELKRLYYANKVEI